MIKSEKYETKRFTVEKLVDTVNDGVTINVTIGHLEFFIKEVEQENNNLDRDSVLDICVGKVLSCINILTYDKKPILINNIEKHIKDWSDFTYGYSEKISNENIFTFNLTIIREQHSARKPFILKFIEEYNKGVNNDKVV